MDIVSYENGKANPSLDKLENILEVLGLELVLRKKSDGSIIERENETQAYAAMGRYTLQDFEVFGLSIGIPPKRLKQIYSAITNTTAKVEEAVNKSFLSDKGKEAYLEKYHDRLENGLLYRIDMEEYWFESVLN